MTAWERHVDEHLEPWGGTPSDDCRHCVATRTRAVIADVLRELRGDRRGDFDDDEITEPDALLPPEFAAPATRR